MKRFILYSVLLTSTLWAGGSEEGTILALVQQYHSLLKARSTAEELVKQAEAITKDEDTARFAAWKEYEECAHALESFFFSHPVVTAYATPDSKPGEFPRVATPEPTSSSPYYPASSPSVPT